MVDYCLFDQLTGSPTPGGIWTYTSAIGGGSILVGVCPCNNPALVKTVGQTLGANEQICVRLSIAGTYTFTYDVSNVSSCCNPCSSTVTIVLSEGNLTMNGSGSQCNDTLKLHSVNSSAICCTSNLSSTVEVRMDSCDGTSNPPKASTVTTPLDIFSGWTISVGEAFDIHQMELHVLSCEGNSLTEQKVTVGGQENTLSNVCTGFYDFSQNTFTNISYYGTCSGNLADYYKCIIEEAIANTPAITTILGGTPAQNGVHYDLTVTGTSSLDIKFRVREMQNASCCSGGGCNNWIVPKTGSGADKLKHNFTGSQYTGCGCEPNCYWIPGQANGYSMNTNATLFPVSNVSISMSFNPVIGFCRTYNITNITFSNILSLSNTNYKHIETQPFNNWIMSGVTTSPAGILVNVGGNTWVNTCGKFTLYANSTTCTGTNAIEWSNPGKSGSNFSTTGEGKVFAIDDGGTFGCISTKISCGSPPNNCTKCAHICIKENPLTITSYLEGDCTCGCAQNPGCNDCSSPPN